jgi:hypothetical protein
MEFDPDEFLGSTPQERISKCRAFAAEATSLAQTSDGAMRDGYLGLAREWIELADEIEAVENGKANGVRDQ